MPRQKRIAVKRDTQQLTSRQPPTPLVDAEFAFVHAKHAVGNVDAQEERRRLRVRAHIAEGNADDADIRLADAQQSAEDARLELTGLEQRYSEILKQLDRLENDCKSRSRECESLRTELEASQTHKTDASTLLVEKLSLSREITNLKPELEHLRSQASAHSNLLSEKLGLQAQLRDAQAELEESRRQVKRVEKQVEKQAKRDEAAENEIEEVKKELSEVRKAQIKAEKEHDKASTSQAQAAHTANQQQVEDLRAEVAIEQKERQKLEKVHAKEKQAWKAEKAVLDDKLGHFRSKLKTTKEGLRNAEAELETIRSTAAAAPMPTAKAVNPRKRKATQSFDADAAIGTPGDGDGSKRQKRASSVVGEKSTFSITPFLNRTSSVQPDGADEPMASIEEQSPSSRPPTRVLAPASAGKSNPKTRPSHPARKRSAAAPTSLEQVAEEEDSNDENTIPASTTASDKEKPLADKPTKPALKPRKSLANFASFREGSLQPRSRLSSVEPVTKKKRKLLGSAGGKTLMDDDEEGETVGGAMGSFGGRSLLSGGGQRSFGSFGMTAAGFGGGLLNKRKGPLQTADGFAFSPLKKERKAIAAASRAASVAPDA